LVLDSLTFTPQWIRQPSRVISNGHAEVLHALLVLIELFRDFRDLHQDVLSLPNSYNKQDVMQAHLRVQEARFEPSRRGELVVL